METVFLFLTESPRNALGLGHCIALGDIFVGVCRLVENGAAEKYVWVPYGPGCALCWSKWKRSATLLLVKCMLARKKVMHHKRTRQGLVHHYSLIDVTGEFGRDRWIQKIYSMATKDVFVKKTSRHITVRYTSTWCHLLVCSWATDIIMLT